MMTRKPPRSRLIGATALLIASPLLIALGYVWWRYILAWAAYSDGAANTWLLLQVGYFAPGLALTVLMLWKRRIDAALCVYGVTQALSMGAIDHIRVDARDGAAYAEFGVRSAIQGVSVECNGVTLGETPFMISRRAFREQVQPWDTPPRQPMFEVDRSHADSGYWEANMYYLPRDAFERTNVLEDRPTIDGVIHEAPIESRLRESRYWWRFEKHGCTGLATIWADAYDQAGWTSFESRAYLQRFDPPILFPSHERHLTLILDDLRRHGGVPTREWVAHFREYQDLLFLDFHAAVQKDHALVPALHAVVRADFRIPEEPTEADCERIVDEILDRVDRRKGFLMPSSESVALDLIGAQAAEAIASRYLEVRPQRLSWGGHARGNWLIERCAGPAAGQLPLTYALKRHPVPRLFDRLVYHAAIPSSRAHYLPLVAAYDREEAAEVFCNILAISGTRGRWTESDMVRIAANIINPRLEGKFGNLVERYGYELHARDYVETRLGAPGIDQGELAAWIFSARPSGVPDEMKVDYLIRIDTPEIERHLHQLASRNVALGERAIERLAAEPNPHCAPFLVTCCRDFANRQFYRGHAAELCTALVKADTPEVRAVVTEMWTEWPDSKETVLAGLNAGDWEGPGLEWMTRLLTTLTTEEERTLGVGVLAKIGSAEAWATITRWAEEGAPDLKARVRQLDEERRRREAEEEEDVRLARELIAGRIKPDDLLPPMKAYVWNGEDYVEEEGGEES